MQDLKDVPNNPGCYLFKDKNKRVIYIGKAKNLKKRIKTYQIGKNLDIKTKAMLKSSDDFEYFITDNEIEALILENTLIKRYQPKYNVRLKDAKSHAYIKVTDEKFPKAEIARRKAGKGKYYGPFVSAQERNYILYFLTRTFKLRTCKILKKKPCLRYHIKLCDAPCADLISKADYNKKIKKIKKILSGKTKELIVELKDEMNKLSKEKKFEQAMIIRDEINALEHLSNQQKMIREKKYNEDIINYLLKDDFVYLMLFNIYKGTLYNKNEFVFEKKSDFFEEFLIQYYSDNPVPKEIIIPKKIDESIISFFENKRGSRVKTTIPKKGEKKDLLDLVKKNIKHSFFSDIEKLTELEKVLKLDSSPDVIECFDISHLSGTSTVGSMVQFRLGKPDKNNYRRFKIRTVEGIDDTQAIAEVVKRRYTRLKNENKKYPDLIIIDGGKAQLNFALDELNNINVKIPIIAIAKRYEEIYIPGYIKSLRLNKKNKGLLYIQEIRNEAHRFAINYNRLLRKKEMIS